MPVKFRKQHLASESYESAGIARFLGRAWPEIVSGAWMYLGPDYRTKLRVWDPPAAGEYYDDFSTIALDCTGNGYPDIVTGGWFGRKLFLLKNPGPGWKGTWESQVIDTPGNIETTRAWDLDGDGWPEIVPNLPGCGLTVYKIIVDGQGKPTGQWQKIVLTDEPQGHGLGMADMNGDGRPDLLVAHGWWEAPAKPWEERWIFHPAWQFQKACVPILAHDFNGDGRPEVIVSEAHDYRLSWFARSDGGEWVEHPIDPFQSQYHDLQLCDIDGDGQLEFVTGKRYYAHCGRDPGENDDLGLFYFKWTGAGFSKQIIDYGPFGVGKGCGIHFAIGDLNGNGRPDIVAPGKDGLCIYWNLGT